MKIQLISKDTNYAPMEMYEIYQVNYFTDSQINELKFDLNIEFNYDKDGEIIEEIQSQAVIWKYKIFIPTRYTFNTDKWNLDDILDAPGFMEKQIYNNNLITQEMKKLVSANTFFYLNIRLAQPIRLDQFTLTEEQKKRKHKIKMQYSSMLGHCYSFEDNLKKIGHHIVTESDYNALLDDPNEKYLTP